MFACDEARRYRCASVSAVSQSRRYEGRYPTQAGTCQRPKPAFSGVSRTRAAGGGSRGVVQRAQHSAQRGREKGNASLEAGPAASTPLQAPCQSERTGKRERRRHLEDRDRARFAAPFVQTGPQWGIARRRKNRWRQYPNALPGGTDVAPVDDARFPQDQGANHEISQSLPALRGARAGIDAHRACSGRSEGAHRRSLRFRFTR